MFSNDLVTAMVFFVGGGICYLVFLKGVENPFSSDNRGQAPLPSNYFGMWGIVIICMILFIIYLCKWLS